MRLRSDLILLLVALIWGSAFVAQRLVANTIGVFLFNGLRFLIAGVLLLGLARFRWRIERRYLPWVLLAGLLLFFGGGLQQAGMRYTTAGNAGFITTLYVVLVPIILTFWRGMDRLPILRSSRKGLPAMLASSASDRPGGEQGNLSAVPPLTWAAALMAVFGVFLLSGQGRLQLAPGDGLELLGAFFWALHVILVGELARRVDVLSFSIGQYLTSGALNLLVGLAIESAALPGILPAMPSILYVGVFSVALGYTLQAAAQRHAPPADAALLLSMESVFAALFGALLLGEMLSPVQWLGCVLILAAVLLAQWQVLRQPALT